ncbi:MAG: hypothetical protein N2043_00705 [Ignavibacterium sp.]|nr:hypothetical protein [Ignavibacterium sp.]
MKIKITSAIFQSSHLYLNLYPLLCKGFPSEINENPDFLILLLLSEDDLKRAYLFFFSNLNLLFEFVILSRLLSIKILSTKKVIFEIIDTNSFKWNGIIKFDIKLEKFCYSSSYLF